MHLRTRAILGVATVGAAIGAALVPATNAFAAPTMAATWATQAAGFGLQNGDAVSVSGSGFKPSSTVYLVECSGTTGQANCDLSTLATGQSDASGALPATPIAVHTGTVGDGACNANSVCYVAGSTDAGGTDLTQASAAPIQFDRLQISPRTGLKNGSVLQLSGAGYGASKTVYVSECNSADKATALQHCDTSAVKTFPADANGAFTGTYTVRTPISASSAGPFACTPGKTCVIAGTDSIANPGAGAIGGGIVAFAPVTKTVTKATGPAHVAKGAKFAVKATVTAAGNGVAGLTVTLYKVKSTGLTKIASAKTGSTGKHKFGALKQKKTSKYEVKTSASSSYAASVSKVVKVATP
jgi:hypothetical protein